MAYNNNRRGGGYSQNQQYPRNDRIRTKEVLLIDQDGEKVGKVKTDKALERAKNAELDLVVVAPQAKPPVAKIIDWSKFKYEQEKKEKENRKKSRQKKDKAMRFPATIAEGDMDHKSRRVEEFLEKGHKVRIEVYVKGRLPFERAKEVMDKVMERFSEYETLEERPKRQGRKLTVTFKPE